MKRFTIPITILILAIFYSCGPNFEKPDEVITVIPAVKAWAVSDSSLFEFQMTNSSEEVIKFNESFAGSSGGGTAYGEGLFSYHIISYQDVNQDFYSEQTGLFSIEMQPSKLHQHGNLIDFTYQKTKFSIDMSDTTIYSIRVEDEWEYISRRKQNGKVVPFNTTIEFLDTMTIRTHLYDTVMKFELLDLEDLWTDETIVELFYSKGVGLVKYVENGGEVYERIWKD